MRPGTPSFLQGETQPQPSIPKEAELSAEVTFIKACATLDSILEDHERWSLKTQRELAQKFEDARNLNQKYLEYQAEAMRLHTTPHFRFKPSLMRLNDGRFLAILGSTEDLNNAIVGVGGSAEEALQRFDETFQAGVPANMLEYLAKREAALDAGQTPPPISPTPEPQKPAEEPAPRKKKNRKQK